MNGLLLWLWTRLPLNKEARSAIIWLLSPKFTVGAVGLLRDGEGRVLLLRHTYRPRHPWGLPGGGLHYRESLEDCLRREMREEVGMNVEVVRFLTAAAHRDRRLVDMVFECRPEAGESLASFKPNAEVSEACYFDPAGLPAGASRGLGRLLGVAIARADGVGPAWYN